MSDPTIPPPSPDPIPPVPPTMGYETPIVETDPQARNLAMVAYILNLTFWVGPLILFLLKKDDPTTKPFVIQETKKALNWGITLQIGIIIGIVTTPLFCIGALLNIALIITNIVFVILNAMKASKGEPGSHPFAIPFVK